MSSESYVKKLPSMLLKSIQKINTTEKILETIALVVFSVYIIYIKPYSVPHLFQSKIVKLIAVIVTILLLYCCLPVGVMFGFAMIYSFILSEATEGFTQSEYGIGDLVGSSLEDDSEETEETEETEDHEHMRKVGEEYS